MAVMAGFYAAKQGLLGLAPLKTDVNRFRHSSPEVPSLFWNTSFAMKITNHKGAFCLPPAPPALHSCGDIPGTHWSESWNASAAGGDLYQTVSIWNPGRFCADVAPCCTMLQHSARSQRFTNISEAGSSKLMPAIGYGTCCRPGARGEELVEGVKAYLAAGGRPGGCWICWKWARWKTKEERWCASRTYPIIALKSDCWFMMIHDFLLNFWSYYGQAWRQKEREDPKLCSHSQADRHRSDLWKSWRHCWGCNRNGGSWITVAQQHWNRALSFAGEIMDIYRTITS